MKISVGLVEGIIQLFLKQYNSCFITYEKPPVIYTINDFSEAVYTKGVNEGTLQIEQDDITMKTKRSFGLTLGTLTFNRQSFFNNLSGLIPYWDDEPTNVIHADSHGVYTMKKIYISVQ